MNKRDMKALRGIRRQALLDLGIDPRGPRAQRIPDRKKADNKKAARGKVRF